MSFTSCLRHSIDTLAAMSLTDVWRNLRGLPDKDKPVPASQVIPRLRESSGVLPIINPDKLEPSPTPAPRSPSSDIVQQVAAATPAWEERFPGHYRALSADLEKRGEKMANWELCDARDVGVTEHGHSVTFSLRKRNSATMIQVELTMFKGKLAKIRVN
ncbi:MAG: hypothetical protein AAB263_12220 [Planctomycetota bacterium]